MPPPWTHSFDKPDPSRPPTPIRADVAAFGSSLLLPHHAALSRAHRLRKRRVALARRVLAFRTARRRSLAAEDGVLPIRRAMPPEAFASAPALPLDFGA
jgi:hypothetical protein